jgi:hypothetical protein
MTPGIETNRHDAMTPGIQWSRSGLGVLASWRSCCSGLGVLASWRSCCSGLGILASLRSCCSGLGVQASLRSCCSGLGVLASLRSCCSGLGVLASWRSCCSGLGVLASWCSYFRFAATWTRLRPFAALLAFALVLLDGATLARGVRGSAGGGLGGCGGRWRGAGDRLERASRLPFQPHGGRQRDALYRYARSVSSVSAWTTTCGFGSSST